MEQAHLEPCVPVIGRRPPLHAILTASTEWFGELPPFADSLSHSLPFLVILEVTWIEASLGDSIELPSDLRLPAQRRFETQERLLPPWWHSLFYV